MKPKTLLMIEATVAVAAIAMTLAVNFSPAAAQTAEPAPANASSTPPPAPAGEPEPVPPAVPALVPLPLKVSPGMDEIFQLARSGVSEEVLTAFVDKSGKQYNPSVEEIIYLKDLGVTPAAIARVIRTGNRDSEVAARVEAGQFDQLKPDPAVTTTEKLEADGKTTVNVNTKVYAAAPQPLETSEAPAAAPEEATTNVDLSYFKSALSPYGNWIYVDGHGECWQPTVGMVSSDWRPYYDGGRWIYSNCGWYWLSDYSWGWAPFHYGRWYQHSSWGWVWTPGYSWGPAWVEWRTTSAYCGWAPLPPYYGSGFGFSYWGGGWGFSIGWSYYNWVPYRYCNGYYPRHYAHHGGGYEHYNNSTVVRPTINVNGNNNTVIVTGPDATVVANASRREIRRVDIRDVDGADTRGPREYIENGGRTLAAYRPTVRPDRDRPEVALANQRAEFRRPANVQPTGGSSSAMAVTDAEAANPRNIIMRGEADATRSPASASAWRSATTSRSLESVATPRTAGQNTTINTRPEYRRPASEPTTIGRSALITRPTTLGETAVGGAARSESSRPTTTWTPPSNRSLNDVPRQSVATSSRSFQPPAAANAPAIAPSRQSTAPENRSSAPTSNMRSEPSRNPRPVIAPSAAPSRSETPAMRTPAMAPPSIAPSARPASSPSFSSPSSPQPSRSVIAPSAAPAPSRSSAPPPASTPGSSGGGGGSRSGGPRR